METSKLTENLKAKLQDSSASEKIRIIGQIEPPVDSEPSGPLEQPSSREAYRKHMIDAQARVRSSNTAVLDQVRALGLQPGGGVSTGSFYVEASPSDIEHLTEIDGISSLSLDKHIELIRPVRPLQSK